MGLPTELSWKPTSGSTCVHCGQNFTDAMEHYEHESKCAGPLPCPFCGGTRIVALEGSTYRWVVAECADCGGRCGEVRAYDDYSVKNPALIAAWNTRALSSRDREIREVLEGLRYSEVGWCWCKGPGHHTLACLAARGLWNAVQGG